MNECTDYLNDPFVGKRRIVCAAINYKNTIVLGIRHHDSFMNEEIKRLKFLFANEWDRTCEVQGFVDQWGNFMNREDARIVASATNQIIKRCGGDTNQLFSENLY